MEMLEQTISHPNYFAKVISFSKIKMLLLYLPLSLLITYFVFSPTIYIPFYHHDSYKFSVGTPQMNCIRQALLPDPLVRPIHIYLDCLNYTYASSLSGMSHMRFLCIAWIGLLISLFALWLTTLEIPPLIAFFFSSSIFFLSALQTALIMAATHLIFSISAAFLSYLLFEKSYRMWSHNLKDRIRSSVLLVFSTLSLLISLFTYPVLSSFFLIPTLLMILFKPVPSCAKTRKIAFLSLLLFSSCNLLYFLIAKYMQLLNNIPDTFSLNHDIIGRIIGIIHLYSGFWNIHLNNVQFWFFFIIILGGISSGILKFTKSPFFIANKSKAISYLLQLLVTFFILVIAGNIIMLISSSPAFVGRVAFTLHCMIAAILFWSLLNICYLFKKTKDILMIIVTAVFFTSIGIYANYNVTTSALNDNLELNFIVSTIANYMLIHGNNISRIHIIKPSISNFNGKKIADDIYNVNSTNYASDDLTVVNAALLQLFKRGSFALDDCHAIDTDGMSPEHQKNCVIHNPKDMIALTYTRPQDQYFSSPNTILINMNAIDVLASKEKPSLYIKP